MQLPDQVVVVTLGAAGVVAVGPDGTIAVPGIDVPAVDTTGAGDCFLGVLAASLAAGLEWPASLHRGEPGGRLVGAATRSRRGHAAGR